MRAITLFAATLAMSISAAAQAGGSHGGGHGAATGQSGQADAVSRTINVVMHDNYYEPESVSVSPGETVKFVVENRGRLVHEFNLGTPAMHEAHQKEMQMMVAHGVIQGGSINHERMNMDMGNGHSMKHDDPNSVLLEPGESAEVIWTFPDDVSLEFACNVPGHYQAGMYGEVTSE